MDSGDGGDGGLHIVMLPWLAMGHILPFLELSKRMAREGHRISFLSTPANIHSLPKIPPDISPLINLVGFPLPRVDGLPETAEATIDLPTQEQRPYLRLAYDKLEEKLRRFMHEAAASSSMPDWIVYDYAPYWVPRVAAEFGVPCAYYGLYSATVLAFMGSPAELMGGSGSIRTCPEDFMVPPQWVPFPTKIAYRPHEARELFKPVLVPDASGVSEAYRFGAAIEGCKFVAFRSFPEFEPEWVRLLGELYSKPIVPVGVLPPSVNGSDENWVSTFRWLEKREHRSVVYAAFGSESKLSRAQVFKIAMGLELSGLHFVWALRKPLEDGGADDDNGTAVLPEGFMDQTKDRGLLCMGWAPQVEILAHPSVGGFLTHAGWNSIIEGLASGVAIALLPLMFDQGINSRMLEERKIGVEVRRNEDDGSFVGKDIAETLRLVMVEEGETFKKKAREARDLFGNEEMQGKSWRDFMRYLREHRN